MRVGSAVFLSTGGGSGLGAGTARRLAARGARVVFADVAYDAAAALAMEKNTPIETPMQRGLSEEVQASPGAQAPFPPQLGLASEFAALVEHIAINLMLNGGVIRLDGALRMAAK